MIHPILSSLLFDKPKLSLQKLAEQVSHFFEQFQQRTLLVLGSGFVGKSTFCSVARAICEPDSSMDGKKNNNSTNYLLERMVYQDVVRTNLLNIIHDLFKFSTDNNKPISSDEKFVCSKILIFTILKVEVVQRVSNITQEMIMYPIRVIETMRPELKLITSHPDFLRFFTEHKHECFFGHGVDLFLKDANDILMPEYCPSDDHVRRCRIKTTGIKEWNIEYNHLRYKLFERMYI